MSDLEYVMPKNLSEWYVKGRVTIDGNEVSFEMPAEFENGILMKDATIQKLMEFMSTLNSIVTSTFTS